jgi:hypothetical protein
MISELIPLCRGLWQRHWGDEYLTNLSNSMIHIGIRWFHSGIHTPCHLSGVHLVTPLWWPRNYEMHEHTILHICISISNHMQFLKYIINICNSLFSRIRLCICKHLLILTTTYSWTRKHIVTDILWLLVTLMCTCVAVVFVFLQLLPSDGIYFEPMMTVVRLWHDIYNVVELVIIVIFICLQLCGIGLFTLFSTLNKN